ncbi:hypothetical protein [Nocardiopsis sp. NPDC055824]
MTDQPDRAALLAWAADAGLDDSVLEDERLPAHPDRPLTMTQLADELCDTEGLTDPEERAKRRATVQRWRSRIKGFPAPAIPDPPTRVGSGRASAVFSAAKVYAAIPRGRQTDEALLDRLATQGEPMPLSAIATALGLHHDTVNTARDDSLERLAQGADPEKEIPAPVAGEHHGYGALYDPAAFAHFWRNRPGQGRKTGRAKKTTKETP